MQNYNHKVICSNVDKCLFTGCEHALPHNRGIDCIKGMCSATGVIVQCIPIRSD